MLQKLIEENPKFRERKNKYKATAHLLLDRYPTLKFMSDSMIEDVVFDAIKADREWRKILQDNPDLRGSDYSDKDELEERAREELGYSITP